ncbi:undecaprenyl-diphosphate phosphatase [Nesterenkonia sp. E16_7]|uniref:undecaprenyl-diphosphate phosphatase n=1 Tax=unclassified Nesterenkonia TaxID=2629769 RepID=UPI001A930BCD|nr:MULTISPECIES: undecaprenyl-diphosphate phosphatase [unclassified Nesterenkonia]MBO0594409.1 undecaprenyl-diphosphate phosphatase [Nesterenkonia sp. E16_10]MBO0598312.1 undecaprenyl-diphosphate phosphatase [Nesterenkonia sp. E16_7]
MSLWESVLLGVIQGLFMFIPVSSSSHLVLVQQWMAAEGSPLPSPDTPEMILYNLVVHLGTMVSVTVVMWRPLKRLVQGIWREFGLWRRRRTLRHLIHLRLALLGLITTAITGVLGLLIRAYGTDVFTTPWAVSLMLLATGIVLWWSDSVKTTWRGAAQMTVMVAVVIGLAQAAALFPGLSRSGLTIAAALALGMHRRLAAQFSFFVAIPTIVAATGLQSLSLLDPASFEGGLSLGWEDYALGFLVSAVVGAGALWMVLRLLYRGHFKVFAVYVVGLALFVLITQPELNDAPPVDELPLDEQQLNLQQQ